MTVSAHSLTAWVGETTIDIKDATITMDESWSPYAQATLTTVLDPTVLEQLDPRQGQRVRLHARQDYGISDKLMALTATFGGGTVAGVTAIWGGTGTVERTNLLLNPSFELATTGWAADGTITRVTTDFYIGSSCARVTVAALNYSLYLNSYTTVLASSTHTTSAYVKGEVGKKLYIRLAEYTSANVLIGTPSASAIITADGTWQRLSVSRTFSASGVKSRLSVSNGTNGAHTFLVDALLLENSSVVGAYFDGSLPATLDASYAWSNPALPQASTSVQKAIKRVAKISEWYFAPYNTAQANKLATLSTLYGALTLAAVSVAWAAQSLWQISAKYTRSYPDGINNNYQRGFNLGIRSLSSNLTEGTLSLTLATDEALLQDYALVSSTNFAPTSLQLRPLIKQVLARIGGYLAEGLTDATMDATAVIWLPGQSAWDYLTPLLQEAGLKLYCDEQRLWHLIDDTFTQPGLAELWSIETIKGLDDIIDRDGQDWFDAVVIKYTWTTAAGAALSTYDIASVDGFSKVRRLEYETSYPGPGAAQRILDRALARGHQLHVTAVSNYALQPSMACDVYILGKPAEHLYIKATSWAFPADTMTVTTRQPLNT
jgi:hypothetical protein